MKSYERTFSVLRVPAYRFFWLGRLISTLATQTQAVTLGWLVYTVARRTHSIEASAFLVGMVGLVQFLPMFFLTLIAGSLVDTRDRRYLLLICIGLQFFCSLGFVMTSASPVPSLTAVFWLSAFFGCIRTFLTPTTTALGPMLISEELLPRAIALNSLSMQGGMILGPWLGGLLSGLSIPLSFLTTTLLFAISFVMISQIKSDTQPKSVKTPRLILIKEGLHYVWDHKVVLGAISLDLFAVLFGGVTALLPVYARDLLKVGAHGFGLLRSGAAIGGCLMALYLSMHPITKKAGIHLLIAVGVYGCATIVFSLSHSLYLSLVMLIILGAADVNSVFIRQNLVQVLTPDIMRGRVAAVSSLFISASNELGEFESGVAARFVGPVGSALLGGIGSVMITFIWAYLFPALRRADRFEKTE